MDAASFKTVIVSMSEGFNAPGLDPMITPSITHSGSVLPLMVDLPRITIVPAEPGCPEPGDTNTPGTLPFNRFSTDGEVTSFNLSLLIV